MNPNLIVNLVDLAIALAQSQLDSGDAKQALLGIVPKSIRAYKNHTGRAAQTWR